MNPKMTVADAAVFLNQTVQNVHHTVKSKGIPHKKSSNRVYLEHSGARELYGLRFPLENRVISVQIVKGGPGKTSIAKNLGIRASLYGARVLLIDLDQQGNLTGDFMSSADSSPVMIDIITDGSLSILDAINNVLPGVDLIPSRLANSALDNVLTFEHYPLDRVLREQIESIKDKYDLIIIDCPPSISASVAAATLASDLVICPVSPEKYCLDGLKMSHAELSNLERKFKRKVPFRVVMNKYDNRTFLSGEVLEQLHTSRIFGERLYKTFIRASQEVSNTSAKRESIFDALRITPAQEDFDAFTREVLDLNSQRPRVVNNDIPLGTLISQDKSIVQPRQSL